MADADLDTLAPWVAAYAARLEPGARKTLARTIAAAVQKSQQERIKRQVNPDGSAFVPRKPQKGLRGKTGALKRGAMFRRLRRSKVLRIVTANQDEAAVGFPGASGGIARVAHVHQEGLSDKVTRAANAKVVQYPARRLLGFTAGDEATIEAAVLAFLEARG